MTALMLISLQNLKINFGDKSLKYGLWEEADIPVFPPGKDSLKREGSTESAASLRSGFPFDLQILGK